MMIYLDRLRNLIREKYDEINEALNEVNLRSSRNEATLSYRDPSASEGAYLAVESETEMRTSRSPIARKEILRRMKQERLRKIKSTITERQSAIEKVMKNSTSLPRGEKEVIREELKQGFDRAHNYSDFRKLFETPSRRYEVLSDVDSDLGKTSFRGYSTYSSASNFFTDESSADDREFKASVIREEPEQ